MRNLSVVSHDMNDSMNARTLHLRWLRVRLVRLPEFAKDVSMLNRAHDSMLHTAQAMQQLAHVKRASIVKGPLIHGLTEFQKRCPMMVLVGNWWTFVLRGICAILFGMLAFMMPGMALLTLVFLFGFYALSDGIFGLIAAFRRTGPEQVPWWALLISGIISILAGIMAFAIPHITAAALLLVIAAWAVAGGIMQIVAAVRLRKQITGEWLLILSGLLSVALGVLLFLFPLPGALAVVMWIAAYAIVFGVLNIALGAKLRKFVREIEHRGHGFPVTA
jgi:uncharacterized membrane protein HdeD (DUF308 family)